MMNFEYSFEDSAWEMYLQSKQAGDPVSALRLLSLFEGEEEDALEDMFSILSEKELVLDISDLPKISGTGADAVRLRQEEQLVHDGFRFRTLSENDPIRLYLEEVTSIHEDGNEMELAYAYSTGEERAMLPLTNIGIQKVVQLAEGYVGYGVLLLDLIQEGSLGLWQAIQNYRGGDYPSMRDRWIQNAMAKAVFLQARNTGVSQKMREAMEDYRVIDERLLSELGRNATIQEIADQMHMQLDEALVIQKMVGDARLVQKAVKDREEPEPDDPEQEQAVEDTAYFQARQRIMELLSTLSDMDAKLLTLRFGLDKGQPLSPEETGKRMGLTPQEVIEREAKALSMLRMNNQ